MNNFPLIGLGIATKGNSGNTLDTFYPCISFKNGEDKTQRDIAEAANVTEVTIRNRYKGLRLDQNMDMMGGK